DCRDLRNALGRKPRLIEKYPAEVLAIGEHLVLHRQKRPSGIDEIDAWQRILERDLLGPKMLFDRNWIVRAAFHGGVVGDDHDIATRDNCDSRHDARTGR